MNEIGFYKEFAEKFIIYLQSYLGQEFHIYYSENKTLDNMIDDLENQAQIKITDNNTYIPKLKLDICFVIVNKLLKPRLLLIEAKYLNQLSLKDYSQLVGYLQVAKNIDIGLLLLIQKAHSTAKLSNDFQEIINLRKLPMDWILTINVTKQITHFKTGIINYIPGNGIDWINTIELNGVSSFEELAKEIENKDSAF